MNAIEDITSTSRAGRPAIILVLTASTALSSLVDTPAALRLTLLLAYSILVPGLCLTGLVSIGGFASECALATALSLAIDTLVVSVLLCAGAWAPQAFFVITLSVTAAVGCSQAAVLVQRTVAERLR